MKISQGANTLAVPTPVWLVGTYDGEDKANIMAAAWAGICNSDPPCVQVSLREARHTYKAIIERKAFTISVPGEEYWRETDYAGMVSGKDANKFGDTVFTPVKSDLVDAPYVEECGMVMECRLRETVNLGTHVMVIGEILDVKVDEEALTDGAPDIQLMKPFIYSPGDGGYHSLGVRIGDALVQKTPPG
jgi:flavin reductase (DIM6/NTAB) family NADH-FMN oxidoreductase RutF